MSTETYWVVRDDEGAGLGVAPSGMDPSGLMWYSDRTAFVHLDSRCEAEALAAEHGGHVVEVTVTERRVGLRWEKNGSDWYLFDGENGVGVVVTDWISYVKNGKESEPWLSGLRWAVRGRKPVRVEAGNGAPDDVIDAAKAAAEAAVKEGWS